ncbi:MAG: hypothetical protein IPJ65_09155 [Archangiaceae bacterium]|nr:hypothetical protein [Archangiaceae bacterium]
MGQHQNVGLAQRGVALRVVVVGVVEPELQRHHGGGAQVDQQVRERRTERARGAGDDHLAAAHRGAGGEEAIEQRRDRAEVAVGEGAVHRVVRGVGEEAPARRRHPAGGQLERPRQLVEKARHQPDGSEEHRQHREHEQHQRRGDQLDAELNEQAVGVVLAAEAQARERVVRAVEDEGRPHEDARAAEQCPEDHAGRRT